MKQKARRTPRLLAVFVGSSLLLGAVAYFVARSLEAEAVEESAKAAGSDFSLRTGRRSTATNADESGTQTKESETSCVNGICTERTLEVSLQPLPAELGVGVRTMGEGLPLEVTPQAYHRVLAATRVVPKGKFAASVGPAAVQALVDANAPSDRFEMLVVVGPLPNVEVASHNPVTPFDVAVREVKHVSGRNLVDASDTHRFSSSLDPDPLFLEFDPMPSLRVTGYQLPGQPSVTYGKQTVALTEPTSATEIRSIAGKLTFKVPLGVAATVLEGSNVNKSTSKYHITGGVKSDEPTKVHFSITRGAELYVGHVAMSAKGKVLEPGRSMRSGIEKLVVTCDYDEKVTSVRVAMADTLATVEESFALSP